ncbi:MAG: C25 family cysteine peptidase [bacterium]
MKLFVSFLIIASVSAHVLNITVPAPDYQIAGDKIFAEHCVYINAPGAPNLPNRKISIALPSGALIESVKFYGVRENIANVEILPAQPAQPLITGDGVLENIQANYEYNKRKYECLNAIYPESSGVLLSKGGLRKYAIVDVLCHHFAYEPSTNNLMCSPNITVQIRYKLPDQQSERARFWQGLLDDITADDVAKTIIYNWEQAQQWYHTDTPHRANGYYIIIPSTLQSSVDTLISHRQNQGYDVNVITKEYIDANIPGDDLPQKIRHYLRANMADIDCVLLVGLLNDLPWRSMVPFNNDPDSPWNNPDYSPIPSDLYYAELTDHDTLSWNSDQDSYYGEVYDQNMQPYGEDNPDYHADIHLGRIPFSNETVIMDICEKMIAFDINTEISYKTAPLLAGAIYYFANENNGGNQRMDGADFCEQLLIDSVFERTNAVSIYEKAGIHPCTLSCTDSLTRNNTISYWQNKGIFYECHHGAYNMYARKIWAWDDGDSIPEANEIQWPTSLHMNDVYQLDNVHPATTFLRSCLCGKPEVTGLGAQLLHSGSSAVISSSRVCWMTYADPGGIPYHFFYRLVKDTTLSNGIIGKAYDIARDDFMSATGFWLCAYHYNLFGDPALRQFGRFVAIEESERAKVSPSFTICPNPINGQIKIMLNKPYSGYVKIDIYDKTGCYVTNLHTGYLISTSKFNVDLPAGVYFLKISDKVVTEFIKIVVIK